MMPRFILLILLLPLFCIGQIPEPKENSYVNDYTQSLTQEQVYQLNLYLQAIEKQSTVQVAILLIYRLPDDMLIEDYAREVGNSWKVGNHFNGMVYVAVLHERKHRLEIAKNLEGDIPDITAGKMIDHLKPYLQQEDYYQALKLLILQIGEALGVQTSIVLEDYSLQPSDANTDPYTSGQSEFEKEKARYDGYGDIIIGIIILGFILFCIWAWRYKKAYREKNTINGVYIGVGSAYFASKYGSSYGSSSGGGSSGFGGFGGSGGGGFSGGGASGSW